VTDEQLSVISKNIMLNADSSKAIVEK
jgi:hypothetical protein